MSEVKVLTPAESMDLIHEFGTKCYKRGYRRAGLEIYGSLLMIGIAYGAAYVYNKMRDKKNKSEEKEIPEEKAE